MKIKTLVNIFTFFSFVIALSIGMIAFLQKNRIDTSIKKEFLANDIVKMVNQREQIINAYLQNPRYEKIIYWQVMYDATVNILQSNVFNSQEEQAILGDMRENNVDINQDFSELIAFKQADPSRKKTTDDVKQLREHIKEQGNAIIDGAYRLSELNQNNTRSALNLAIHYVMICILVLIIVIFSALFLVRINILTPLIKLGEGIRIISSGNLTYKLDTHKKDEINEIIHSFNEMICKLNERTQQQLYLSEKLTRSNTELQQFAYIASHDLQEPLRMISSYLQLIERRYKDQLDKDGREFIDFAVNGAKRLQTMINDLLAFSRVETQANPLVTIQLEDVLNHVLDNLQSSIQENQAIITHDPLPSIRADASQMMTLFQNILSNALKFHTEKPPVIHIAAKHRDGEWLFSIRDNGIGIDPSYNDQLFVIFKRLVGREYAGTGIGLAVCKRIVERHQGKIWVESALNQGSTFYFTIPD